MKKAATLFFIDYLLVFLFHILFYSTNPQLLSVFILFPENFFVNGPYFIQKAQLIGKNTETVIRTVLKSRLYEVQTYRMCLGMGYICQGSGQQGRLETRKTLGKLLDGYEDTQNDVKHYPN